MRNQISEDFESKLKASELDDFAMRSESTFNNLNVLAYRGIYKYTPRDLLIHSLSCRNLPFTSYLSIGLIRLYQRWISPKLGNRCVFDPSCSHFAEYQIRKIGFIKALPRIFNRLLRCNASNGGTDL